MNYVPLYYLMWFVSCYYTLIIWFAKFTSRPDYISQFTFSFKSSLQHGEQSRDKLISCGSTLTLYFVRPSPYCHGLNAVFFLPISLFPCLVYVYEIKLEYSNFLCSYFFCQKHYRLIC